MNSNSPLTQAELVEALHYFFDPIFQMIGGALAVIVIVLAIVFVLKPFIRRI